MSSVFIDTKNQFLRTLELYGKDNYNLSDSQHGLKRIRLNRASYKGSLEILKALFINSLSDKLTDTELRAILHDVASNAQSGVTGFLKRPGGVLTPSVWISRTTDTNRPVAMEILIAWDNADVEALRDIVRFEIGALSELRNDHYH